MIGNFSARFQWQRSPQDRSIVHVRCDACAFMVCIDKAFGLAEGGYWLLRAAAV